MSLSRWGTSALDSRSFVHLHRRAFLSPSDSSERCAKVLREIRSERIDSANSSVSVAIDRRHHHGLVSSILAVLIDAPRVAAK